MTSMERSVVFAEDIVPLRRRHVQRRDFASLPLLKIRRGAEDIGDGHLISKSEAADSALSPFHCK
jgi:hypothetical protein